MRRPGTPPRPVVLIVEDDPWIQTIASALLQDEGYATASATTGEAGLTIAERLRPVVILLDLGLPVMSGCEFLRKVYGHAGLRGTPVIVVSGQTDRLPQDAMDLAAAVVRKPFDVSHLLAQVRRLTTIEEAVG